MEVRPSEFSGKEQGEIKRFAEVGAMVDQILLRQDYLRKGGRVNWILDENRKPVQCSDTESWAKWYQNFANRNIKQTWLKSDYRISTVFLGIDHNLGGEYPILFETMVFKKDGSADSCEQIRSRTEAEALIAHEEMADKYRGKDGCDEQKAGADKEPEES